MKCTLDFNLLKDYFSNANVVIVNYAFSGKSEEIKKMTYKEWENFIPPREIKKLSAESAIVTEIPEDSFISLIQYSKIGHYTLNRDVFEIEVVNDVLYVTYNYNKEIEEVKPKKYFFM